MVIRFILMLLWAFLTYYIACGLLWPISFSLGILGPLLSLGILGLFLILQSHGLLLILLGFPGPITLSFILGAHGLPINPLLFLFYYFGPIVAYSYFSTSHDTHGFTTSFSRLIQAHLLSSRSIYLLYGPMIHYACHSGLKVFLLITNSFQPILLGFFLLLGFQNEHQHNSNLAIKTCEKFRSNN